MTNTDISGASKIMLGSTQASKMYIGNTLMWPVSLQLPYDAEIEYLESDGNLYIDTGIIPNARSGMYVKCECNLRNSVDGEYTVYVCGVTPDENNKLFSVFHSEKKWGICENTTEWMIPAGTNSDGDMSALEHHLVEIINRCNDSYFYMVDNGYKSSAKRPPNMYNDYTNTIKLFNVYGNITTAFKGKIHRFKYTSNPGTYVLDLIPVRIGQVGYMYDKISGLLYGNNGTGSFTLGPDHIEQHIHELPVGWTELEYIESGSSSSEYTGLYIDLNELLYLNPDSLRDFGFSIKYNYLGYGMDNHTQSTVFGCQENISPYPGVFVRYSTKNGGKMEYRLGDGDNYYPSSHTPNTVLTYDYNTLKGYNSKWTTHTWGTSLFCFFSDAQNTPSRFSLTRLYNFKLWKHSKLVKDLIPCKNANNVVGLYDKINDTFYTSPNGVPFYAGPAVT